MLRPAALNLVLAGGLLLVALAETPFLLRGESSMVRVHDNFDGLVPLYAAAARPESWDPSGKLTIMLGGVPAASLSAEPKVQFLFYRLLSPFWAYVCNDLAVRWVGFAGMFLLLAWTRPGSGLLEGVVALAFASLPFFSSHGLSIAGQPALLLSILVLARPDSPARQRCAAALYLVFFAFYSYLPLVGVFSLVLLGPAWLVMMLLGKPARGLFLAILILAGAYAAANAALLLEMFSSSPTVWARQQFSVPQGIGLIGGARETLRLLKDAHYHAPANPFPIVWLCLLMGAPAAWASWRTGTAGREELAGFGAALLAISAIGAGFLAYNLGAQAVLTRLAPSLKGLNTSRWYWFLPFALYAGQAFALRLVASRLGRAGGVVVALAAAQFALNLSMREWREVSRDTHARYAQYVSAPLFQRVADIARLPRHQVRVGCVGFHPGAALLNGFATVDGYLNLYPLEYKHRFRKVIAGELARSRELEEYFDKWGLRCYLFSAELGKNFLVSKERATPVTLRFDTAALADLGCHLLLSAVPVANARELGIRPLEIVRHPGALMDLHVYEVPPVSGRDTRPALSSTPAAR